MSSSGVAVASFGRLWGRGHERLVGRRVLQVVGPGATLYLQNLVTSNLLVPPTPPTPEPVDTALPGVPARVQKSMKALQQQQQQQQQQQVEFNPQLRSTCFLDPKGRVITDSLLWKVSPEHYYLDVPDGDSGSDSGGGTGGTSTADALLQHLQQYKLRRTKVTVSDCSDTVHSYVVYGTLESAGTPEGYLAGLDPRHPSLGLRVLQLPPQNSTATATAPNASTVTAESSSSSSSSSDEADDRIAPPPSFSELMASQFPDMPGNYELVRRLAGVAEGSEIAGRVALETNQELLQAVSFDKGCYLGQELTARVFHTGVLRKRILPLLLQDAYTQVPQAWAVASSLQEGRSKRTFTEGELKGLPSRLPRLSVLTAGNLVAVTTGSIQPAGDAVDEAAAAEWQAAVTKTAAWLEDLEVACVAGAKLVDAHTGSTIGQIVAPPVQGTNVVLAVMRLEAVGLLHGGTCWSKTNKISVNGKEFRYLPYLPLWWPELSMETGKAKTANEDYSSEARRESDKIQQPNAPPGMTRVEIEEIHGDKEPTTTTTTTATTSPSSQ